MLKVSSKNIGILILIFLISLLFLVTSVLAGEVIVLGGQLVPAQTVTNVCDDNPKCCDDFYKRFEDLTYIVKAVVVNTIQPTSSASRTFREFICTITLIK